VFECMYLCLLVCTCVCVFVRAREFQVGVANDIDVSAEPSKTNSKIFSSYEAGTTPSLSTAHAGNVCNCKDSNLHIHVSLPVGFHIESWKFKSDYCNLIRVVPQR